MGSYRESNLSQSGTLLIVFPMHFASVKQTLRVSGSFFRIFVFL